MICTYNPVWILTRGLIFFEVINYTAILYCVRIAGLLQTSLFILQALYTSFDVIYPHQLIKHRDINSICNTHSQVICGALKDISFLKRWQSAEILRVVWNPKVRVATARHWRLSSATWRMVHDLTAVLKELRFTLASPVRESIWLSGMTVLVTFTIIITKSTILKKAVFFWVVASCSLVEAYRLFTVFKAARTSNPTCWLLHKY